MKPKKKKNRINARILWLLLILLTAIFIYVFSQMEMLPDLWKWTVLFVGVLIVLITGFFSIKFYRNIFIKGVDVFLFVALTVGSVLLPHYQNEVSDLIDSVGGTVTISLYAVNANYRNSHPEVFDDSYVSADLSDYAGGTIITSLESDNDNQTYAFNALKNQIGEVVNYDCQSVQDEVDALYSNYGDAMLLSDNMLGFLMETTGYEDFLDNTIKIATFTKTFNAISRDVNLTSTPFTILFAGNDEEGALTLNGRTDVNMLVTVNPNSHQIVIVTIPRDSYIPNPHYDGQYDKLTHLGLAGISNTMDGLNQFFDVDSVKNYIIVNFTTYRSIINALGGVDVNNDIAFYADDDEYFDQGTIHLEGDSALMYVRERHAFDNGDFERNYHQQLVMQAIINKLTSAEVIKHFNDLLDSLKGTFTTNISSDSIYHLCKKQLSENIDWNIVKYGITGNIGVEECASAPGEYLSVVYPDEGQVSYVSSVIQNVLGGEKVSQDDLSSYTTDEVE